MLLPLGAGFLIFTIGIIRAHISWVLEGFKEISKVHYILTHVFTLIAVIITLMILRDVDLA